MKVAIPSIELDDDQREAIAYFAGKTGVATRADIVEWVDNLIQTTLETIAADYEATVDYGDQPGSSSDWESDWDDDDDDDGDDIFPGDPGHPDPYRH